MSALAEHTVADQDDFQDEELASFIDVEELAKLGVNQADITKLKQAGITTVRVSTVASTSMGRSADWAGCANDNHACLVEDQGI